MTLSELIKNIVHEVLEEDGNVSGAVGAYSTPFAFARKGQKTNAATKVAGREGFKKVPTGMPSDSKVKDYKSLWGRKKKYKIYKESDYDKASPSQNSSPYGKASGYTGIGGDDHVNQYYKDGIVENGTDFKEKDLVSFTDKGDIIRHGEIYRIRKDKAIIVTYINGEKIVKYLPLTSLEKN